MSASKRFRVALFVILGIAAALAVVAAGFAVPWVRRPPITPAEADAALADYAKIVDRMAALTPEDRAAIDALLARWTPRIEAATSPLRVETDCPILPDDFGPATTPFLADARVLSDAMAAIVDDGFVLRQLATPEADVINYTPVREWMRWEGALAILDARAGDTPGAAKRIERLARATEGVVGTPILIHVLMATAMDGIADLALLASAPRLDVATLDAIAKSRRSRTKYDAAFRDAVATEAVWLTRQLESVDPGLANVDPDSSPARKFAMRTLFAVNPRRALARERDVYLFITREYLAHLDEDILSGADPLRRLQERGVRSVVAESAWPNMPLLRAKVLDRQKRFDAVTSFVERLAASGPGGLGAHTFPYDADHEIWIDGQAVCVK